jgi:hypothetical protein
MANLLSIDTRYSTVLYLVFYALILWTKKLVHIVKIYCEYIVLSVTLGRQKHSIQLIVNILY